MHRTNLRKVGGSVMLTVPPAFLEQLQLQAGSAVGMVIDNGRLIIEPPTRRRYTLDALLDEVEASKIYPLPPDEREWIDAPTVGHELI